MRVLTIPVTPFQQNCAVLICQETLEAAVIDPGGDLEKIYQVITEAGCKPTKVLITHGHIDHAGRAGEFAQHYDIPIEGPHREDLFWIEQLAEHGRLYQFPKAASFTPTRWLEDNDQITVGRVQLQVKHCPGHTPGHVIFYAPKFRLAFVGDVLFKGSIGRTDFPKGDHQTLLNSITQQLWPLGNEVQFYCGHGPTSTFGNERKSNPFVGDSVLQ